MSHDMLARRSRALHAALINRDFARLWYGQAISTLGDTMFSTTLVLWVATVLAKAGHRRRPR